MIFFLSTQKHKTSNTGSITKAFGEHKADAIESTLRIMRTKMLIQSNESGEIILL